VILDGRQWVASPVVVRPPSGGAARSVAICICTRNRPRELAVTLDSIRRSTYPVRRVVVSDDGTDPETKKVSIGSSSAPIVVYSAGPMRGLGANRNHALGLVEEDLVLFLDDDCLLRPSFLSVATACMLRHERLHGMGRVIISGSEENRGRTVVAHAQNFLGFQARPYRAGEALSSIVINATVFPRAVFDEHCFDPQIRYGYEEADLASRLARAGYRIISCPAAANEHRPSERGRSDYDEVLGASRLYITFKRYALVDRRYLQALAFAVVAPVHAVLAGARRRGRAGAGDAMRATALAARYLRGHARSRSTSAPRDTSP
jgi:GT2 family glycosyltransferase